jgi:hypothetical protein
MHRQLLLNSASLMAETVVLGASWQDMLAAFTSSSETRMAARDDVQI